jgi:hypothetical protein
MKKRMSLVLVGLFLFIFVPKGSFAEEARPVGRVVALEGEVDILHEGQEEPEVARLMSRVYLLDQIETMEESKVKILMNDDSVITLSENTHLTIDEFVYSPKKKERRSLFTMLKGKTKFLVGRLLGFRSRYRVKTPTATVGVRGTLFIVWTATDAIGRVVTFVLPLEGTLETANVAIPDQVVEVSAGYTAEIVQNIPPTYEVTTDEMIQEAIQGTDVLVILPREPEVLEQFGIPPGEINEIERELQETAPAETAIEEASETETVPNDTQENVNYETTIPEIKIETIKETLPRPPLPPSN